MGTNFKYFKNDNGETVELVIMDDSGRVVKNPNRCILTFDKSSWDVDDNKLFSIQKAMNVIASAIIDGYIEVEFDQEM